MNATDLTDLGVPVVEAIQHLLSWFDYGATVLWAISGAILAARKGYDVLGVFILALVSAAGGGLVRDGLFLQNGPPVLVRNSIYVELVAASTLLVLVFGRHFRNARWMPPAVNIVDALGLGAFAVVGMNLAIARHLPVTGVIVVGMANAVGGSVLRDILMREEAQLMRPGVWMGMAALIGCLLFVTLLHFDVSADAAGTAAVFVVFVARLMAVRFDLRSRPLKAFAEDWGPPQEP
jgi:uncharacterized membrane protein YeiH